MTLYKDISEYAVQQLLARFGMNVHISPQDEDIPHSFWGSPEAGRLNTTVYIRIDTPIHSLLHESCHYVCMPRDQRNQEVVDAKGSTAEENATCYLQILLADQLQGYNQNQILNDMDDWGYSFRLGSAKRWFTEDAEDVKEWLIEHEIINHQSQITWQLRQN